MSLLSGKLNQTATYWENNGVDSAGDPQFSAPVSFFVRWDDKVEIFTNSQGEERRSAAVVITDRDIVENSYMFLGISLIADPSGLAAAFEVQSVQKYVSIDGNEFYRRILL